MQRPDWDIFFMSMAHLVSQRSPDAETKIGAVLVGEDHKIISLGFNGFPRGCKDSLLPRTRPDKYFYIVHAEANCLINAEYIPNPQRCTMYVTARPCPECTKQIIQHGIGNVMYGNITTNMTAWDNDNEQKISLMLTEVPLKIIPFGADVGGIIELLESTSNSLREKVKTVS